LDLLGTIGRDLGYQDLVPLSVELAGEKDRAVLPILRRTLEEKRKARY
jgi:hypothetical protein